MPYDMDFDSAPDALQSPSRSDNGILAAMKAAGRALVRSAKRAAGGGIVSALVAAGLALCAPQGANAQCYEFASAGNASVSVNITNLPPPAIVGGVYEYQLQSATGNTVTVTQGSSTWSLTPPFSDFLITVYPYSSPPVAFTNVGIGAESLVDSNLISGIVTLTDSVSDILPTGWPPVTFPPLSDWNATATVQVQVNGVTFGPYNLTSISDCVPPPPPAKTLGSPCDGPGGCGGGDPITLGTGNVFEQALDYSTVGQNPLAFTRYYNSMASTSYPNTFATTLGTNWRSTFDRYLNIASGSSVLAERADGQVLSFTLNGSTWTPDSDVDVTLTNAGTVWTLTDHNDTVEKYTASGTKATLQSITLRNGYEQTLNYSSGQLASVTDSYNRELVFGYSGGLLQTLSTPDGLTLTYGFTSAGGSNVLSTVSYSTTPVTNITYQYQNAAFPFALTGLIDENGQPFSNWAYDTNGRGVTSQHGGALGADLTTVIYNPDGTTTATNAFGVADTYTFTTLQGVPKVMQIQRAATTTTAAATRTFQYDPNGYVNYATDWNTNLTTYVNDSHGDPLTIIEAVNSPAVTRTTTIVYDDPVFVHLPKTITTAGLTTGFTYDGNGNPLTQTDTDTTTNTVPYSTGGQTRVTQYMWTTTGQEKSVQLPRTDVVALTQFGYDGTGALISITDALAHETQITAHTGGGLPLTVVDPNNVTTKLTYDQRLNLNTSTLFTTAGKLTTVWTHDLQPILSPRVWPSWTSQSRYSIWTQQPRHSIRTC